MVKGANQKHEANVRGHLDHKTLLHYCTILALGSFQSFFRSIQWVCLKMNGIKFATDSNWTKTARSERESTMTKVAANHSEIRRRNQGTDPTLKFPINFAPEVNRGTPRRRHPILNPAALLRPDIRSTKLSLSSKSDLREIYSAPFNLINALAHPDEYRLRSKHYKYRNTSSFYNLREIR